MRRISLIGVMALACAPAYPAQVSRRPAREWVVGGAMEAPSPLQESDLEAQEVLPQARRAPTRRLALAPGGSDTVAKHAPSETEVATDRRSPLLVYTATLTLAVFEVEASVRAVATAAKELGGFMTQQSNVSITVRVPAATFEDAVRRVEKIGDVTGRQIRAEDVTQEFMDLDIRLKNLRAVRDRLADLLARSTKVEDSLKIEHELERVAQEVDRIEGRLKYLRDQIAFSTITVSFSARREETVAQGAFRLPFPWLDRLGLARLLNVGGGQPR